MEIAVHQGVSLTAEDEALLRLMRRRDAAVADYQKVEEQLQTSRESIGKEARLREGARIQTKDLTQKAKAISMNMQDELERIKEQQVILKQLRDQVRALRGPKNGSMSARSPPPAASQLHGGAQYPESMPTVQRPSSTQATRGRAGAKPIEAEHGARTIAPVVNSNLASAEVRRISGTSCVPEAAASLQQAPSVDASLESLFAEMRHVKQAFAGSHALGHQGASGSRDDAHPGQQEAEDEDAEIELIRPNGVSLARLRHPAGSEVLVSLHDGLLSAWRLANGSFATSNGLKLMHPEMLEGPSKPLWRLSLIDDSNNEPSVTLSCGGDGSVPWQVRRKITVGATWLQEDVWVENLSSGDACYKVFEVESVGAQRLADDPTTRGCASNFQPRQLKTPTESWPLEVAFPPGGCWTATQRWAA